MILKEGKNYNPMANEIINLEILGTLYSFLCYKMTLQGAVDQKGPNTKNWRTILVNFNKSISNENLPTLKIYFTSENNSYGIISNRWLDGEIWELDINELDINKNIYYELDLKAEKHIRLKTTSQCIDEVSFYECYGARILSDNFDYCPRKCIGFSIPFIEPDIIPVCETVNEMNCSNNLAYDLLEHIISTNACPKACSILQYSGKITYTSGEILENIPDTAENMTG